MGALHDWEPPLASIWEQVPPSGTDCWHGRDQWWMVAWPADTKTLGELCRAKDSYARWQWQPEPPEDAWAGPIHVGRAALPEALPIDEDAWLDAFEARGPEDPAENLKQRFDVAREAAYALRTKQLTGARRRTYYGEEIVSAADAADAARNEMRNQGGIGLTGHDLVRSDAVVQALPDPDWQDLDLHLALAWLALRQALAARAPLRLHDGRFVLPIQPGVFAEITVVAAPEDAPTRAGFGRVCEVHLDEASVSPDWSRWTLAPPAGAPTVHLYASPIFAPISTFAGRLQVGQKYGTGAIDLGVVVPAELHLVGEGVAATVRFRAEPYGLAGGAPTPRAG